MGQDNQMRVKLEKLLPNPYQPPSRIEVGEETAERFAKSIMEHGLLQMPVVRMATKEGYFEVGDGWLRRSGFDWLVKHGHAEFGELPCTLREFTDQEMADLVLEANSVRQDMNPIELAWYYRKYLNDFKSITQAKFAQKHNRSQGEIANTMRLLDLPDEVQQLIISRKISESHGRCLLQLKDKTQILSFAMDAMVSGWSVAELDAQIKAYLDKQKPRMIPPEPLTATLTVEPTPPLSAQSRAECDDEVILYTAANIKVEKDKEKSEKEAGEDDTDGGEEETEPQEDETKQAGSETKGPKAETAKAKGGKQSPTKTSVKPVSKFKSCVLCKATVNEKDMVDGRCAKCAKLPRLARPVAVGASPAAATAWKRKLVIQEQGDNVVISIMKEGGFPVMKTLSGTIETTWTQIECFIGEAATTWQKAEVK